MSHARIECEAIRDIFIFYFSSGTPNICDGAAPPARTANRGHLRADPSPDPSAELSTAAHNAVIQQWYSSRMQQSIGAVYSGVFVVVILLLVLVLGGGHAHDQTMP